ncbi:MAG: cytochrome c [Xanthobacteraceae bacterium]|jgi:mono/diheme cytochrome c family protein
MTRNILSFMLVAAVGGMALAAQAKTSLTLKSVDVALPDSTRTLPNGPGQEAVQNNCTGCHSPGMILNQPAMPRAAWQAEVAKMRNVYKAPVEEKDVGAIVDYLTAVKGPK